jgi:hypothetical protein
MARFLCALLLVTLAGCDRKSCDLSQFHVGEPAQEVVKACGLPDSIQIYRGASDEQWSYSDGGHDGEIYMTQNRVSAVRPYVPMPDDTIRIYP